MATFAIIENNKVANLAVADSIEVLSFVLPGANLVEVTEATGPANMDAEYRESKGRFVPTQQHLSWTWNEKKFTWEAPVAQPADGGPFYWDEETLSWIAVSTVVPIEPDEEAV